MGKAAMCGMIGALSITIGTIVIPSENFVRLKANEAKRSAVEAVTLEYKAPSADENQTNTCPHTNGNHTSDCPYWDEYHHAEDESYDSGHHGSSHHGSGHHGGGHHGGGHHGR